MSDDEISTGIDRASLFKQRRFLLVITFALVAIHLLNVELTGHISTPMAAINYDPQPRALMFILWLSWFFAYWRYWQYERSFRNKALQSDAGRELEKIVIEAATSGIKKAVEAGAYAKRNVPPGTEVFVGPKSPNSWKTKEHATTWTLGSLNLYKRKEDGGTIEVEGGANISFDAIEVKAMKRRRNRILIAKYPHFSDYTIPYALALLAPAAGLYDLARWAIYVWICYSA